MTGRGDRNVGTEPADSLAEAQQDMRERQAYWAHAMGADCGSSADTLEAALQAIEERRARQKRVGDYIRDGLFKYKADMEAMRWELTGRIIRRVIPGPCEDPRYAVTLARQAAAVEWVAANVPRGPNAPDLTEAVSHVLIGTTGEPRSEAYTTSVGDGAIVLVSAGMIDFMYQSAKAVVLSWKPTKPTEGSAYEFSARPEDTEDTLKKDPYPADLFYDTLSSWLYEGRPRAAYATAPPVSYQGPLTILINGAERFVVGHEYGHAVVHRLGIQAAAPTEPPPLPKSWIREIQADAFANFVVIQSSRPLDLLPANIAMQGAVVAMKAHQIFEAAIQIATTGEQTGESAIGTHPPFADRINLLEEAYVQSHPNSAVARQDLVGMIFPATTIDQLWSRAAPRLQADFHAGRALHPVWSMPGL